MNAYVVPSLNAIPARLLATGGRYAVPDGRGGYDLYSYEAGESSGLGGSELGSIGSFFKKLGKVALVAAPAVLGGLAGREGHSTANALFGAASNITQQLGQGILNKMPQPVIAPQPAPVVQQSPAPQQSTELTTQPWFWPVALIAVVMLMKR